MRHYVYLLLAVAAVLLALFGAAQALGIAFLQDPTPWLGQGGAAAALVTTGLLLADVLIPVPSSLVMIANGTLFGWAWGTVLTLVGGTGAGAFGWALGRWGRRTAERFVPAEERERERARKLLERWGMLAIVASRPVPILAEATAIAAGLSGMPLGRVVLASALGTLPPAVLYALTGAAAARLDNGFLVFGLVIAVAGIVWLAGLRAGRRLRSAAEA